MSAELKAEDVCSVCQKPVQSHTVFSWRQVNGKWINDHCVAEQEHQQYKMCLKRMMSPLNKGIQKAWHAYAQYIIQLLQHNSTMKMQALSKHIVPPPASMDLEDIASIEEWFGQQNVLLSWPVKRLLGDASSNLVLSHKSINHRLLQSLSDMCVTIAIRASHTETMEQSASSYIPNETIEVSNTRDFVTRMNSHLDDVVEKAFRKLQQSTGVCIKGCIARLCLLTPDTVCVTSDSIHCSSVDSENDHSASSLILSRTHSFTWWLVMRCRANDQELQRQFRNVNGVVQYIDHSRQTKVIQRRELQAKAMVTHLRSAFAACGEKINGLARGLFPKVRMSVSLLDGDHKVPIQGLEAEDWRVMAGTACVTHDEDENVIACINEPTPVTPNTSCYHYIDLECSVFRYLCDRQSQWNADRSRVFELGKILR
jgi:hypothetical protein